MGRDNTRNLVLEAEAALSSAAAALGSTSAFGAAPAQPLFPLRMLFFAWRQASSEPASFPPRRSRSRPGRLHDGQSRAAHRVLRERGSACVRCGRSPKTHPDTAVEVDHIVPVSRGGTNCDDNLQILCQRCNSGKGNRYND